MADNYIIGGIVVGDNFQVGKQAPIDARFTVENVDGLSDSNLKTYEGLISYVKSNQTYYQFQDGAWKSLYVSSEEELQNFIKDYVTGEALTVMEFKGTTASLPSSTGLTKGDFYKVTANFTLPVANNAEGGSTAVSVKKGDSIIYNGDSKWYHIPSGDDIEDTWRPVKAGGNTLESNETLELIAGTNVTITENAGKVTITATDTDTHHEAKLVVGNNASATTDAAATNGNVYLNLVENGAVRSSSNFKGTGAIEVTSESDGDIVLSLNDDLDNFVDHWQVSSTGTLSTSRQQEYYTFTTSLDVDSLRFSTTEDGLGLYTTYGPGGIVRGDTSSDPEYRYDYSFPDKSGTFVVEDSNGIITTSNAFRITPDPDYPDYTFTIYDHSGITYSINSDEGESYRLTFPEKDGTIALTSDIPSFGGWSLYMDKSNNNFSTIYTAEIKQKEDGVSDDISVKLTAEELRFDNNNIYYTSYGYGGITEKLGNTTYTYSFPVLNTWDTGDDRTLVAAGNGIALVENGYCVVNSEEQYTTYTLNSISIMDQYDTDNSDHSMRTLTFPQGSGEIVIANSDIVYVLDCN